MIVKRCDVCKKEYDGPSQIKWAVQGPTEPPQHDLCSARCLERFANRECLKAGGMLPADADGLA